MEKLNSQKKFKTKIKIKKIRTKYIIYLLLIK